MRSLAFSRFLVLLLVLGPLACVADDFGVRVPLARAASGNFYVEGVFNAAVRSSFLVDTGSGLLTVNERLFEEIARTSAVERVGRVAAKLADGRYRPIDVYRVASFRIGEHCELGAVEVAVLTRGGRNILGLNVLAKAAPFAMHLSPPTLALSACRVVPDLLAAN